eukprot:817452-Prymnesium_polylepis.1
MAAAGAQSRRGMQAANARGVPRQRARRHLGLAPFRRVAEVLEHRAKLCDAQPPQRAPAARAAGSARKSSCAVHWCFRGCSRAVVPREALTVRARVRFAAPRPRRLRPAGPRAPLARPARPTRPTPGGQRGGGGGGVGGVLAAAVEDGEERRRRLRVLRARRRAERGGGDVWCARRVDGPQRLARAEAGTDERHGTDAMVGAEEDGGGADVGRDPLRRLRGQPRSVARAGLRLLRGPRLGRPQK